MADQLIDNLPAHRTARLGHWLCRQLDASARLLDPATFADQAGETVRDGLLGLGLPGYMANALGAGSQVVLKLTFEKTQLGSLTKALRVLIPLVCPNFAQCPGQREVIKTFGSETLGEELKRMAGQ